MTGLDSRRGFTLVEMLITASATVIFLVIAISVLLPVLGYLSATQSKIDTQQYSSSVLYKLARELRMSNPTMIFYRPNPSGTSVPLPATATQVDTFAVATAKSGSSGDPCYLGAAFDTDAAGNPNWQGFQVFNLGTNHTLTCVYEQVNATPPFTSIQADTAITAATGLSNPAWFGDAIFNIQLSQESANPTIVDIKIQALSTVRGRTNATTYTQNIMTRQ